MSTNNMSTNNMSTNNMSTNNMSTDKPDPSANRQPEAEASLEAAARSGSRKPDDQGLKARPDTAPQPESPERKQAAAAAILREGARKDTGA